MRRFEDIPDEIDGEPIGSLFKETLELFKEYTGESGSLDSVWQKMCDIYERSHIGESESDIMRHVIKWYLETMRQRGYL
jgi:hypothetical protein